MIEHADDCDGRCGTWLVGGNFLCQPLCVCAVTRKNRPKWAQELCWWVVKTTGRTTSRCPCWGADRTRLPAGCCSWHPDNPRYAAPRPPVTLDDLDVAPLVEWECPARVDAALYDWSDPEEEFGEFERRWTRDELHCSCPTPWDASKVAKGWHCCDCHNSFTSYGVGEVHRRRWTEPCRDPADVRDVDTGFPLLRQGADGVWSAAYPSTR